MLKFFIAAPSRAPAANAPCPPAPLPRCLACAELRDRYTGRTWFTRTRQRWLHLGQRNNSCGSPAPKLFLLLFRSTKCFLTYPPDEVASMVAVWPQALLGHFIRYCVKRAAPYCNEAPDGPVSPTLSTRCHDAVERGDGCSARRRPRDIIETVEAARAHSSAISGEAISE